MSRRKQRDTGVTVLYCDPTPCRDGSLVVTRKELNVSRDQVSQVVDRWRPLSVFRVFTIDPLDQEE